MFWIAVDPDNRVIGMMGTDTVSANDLWLKRLYIKPQFKGKGIGSALLCIAEEYAKAKGIAAIHTRFNDNYQEAARFYIAKGFSEAERSDGLRHFLKVL